MEKTSQASLDSIHSDFHFPYYKVGIQLKIDEDSFQQKCQICSRKKQWIQQESIIDHKIT